MKQSKKCNSEQLVCECCCDGKRGPRGPVGRQGPPGDSLGVQGIEGKQGEQGERGATGPRGIEGPEGVQGPRGVTGPSGNNGSQGNQGPQGDPGLTGPEGPRGPPGTAPAGILDYAEFYSLNPDPPVNLPAVPGGSPLPFPLTTLPGNSLISRVSATAFSIAPGIYRISWQASVNSGGQLQLWAGPVVPTQTAVVRTTIGSQRSDVPLSNTILFEALNTTVISVRNPAGNNQITFRPGGTVPGLTNSVSANLVIECIAPPRSGFPGPIL